jgi:hypothetical protein
MPAISHQICPELLIFDRQILTRKVGHKEVSDENTGDAGEGGDDECPSDAEVVLDREEYLCAYCCSGFA